LDQVDPPPSLRELITDYPKLERSDSMSGVLLRKIILKSEADKANDTLAKYGVHFFKNPSPGLEDTREELEIFQNIVRYDSLILIYRIFQNSMNNILKHAEASEIQVN
jgi:hypothetical protein